MVVIKCSAIDCIFWDEGLCSSDEITYDPDEGCLTYEILDDLLGDDIWEDDEDLDDLVDDTSNGEFYLEDTEDDVDDDDDEW